MTSDNVQSLIMASDLWQMYPVKDICVSYMERLINIQNCWGILQFSKTYSCKTLYYRAKELIRQRFPVAVQSPEFLNIGIYWVEDIISTPDLVTEPEGEDVAAKAAVRWLECNQFEDESEVQSLLRAVLWQCTTTELRKHLIETSPVLCGYPERLKVIAKVLVNPYHSSRRIDTSVYVIGGYPSDRTGPKHRRLKSVEAIKNEYRDWFKLADFPMESCGSFAFNLRGRLFCCGYEPITAPNSNVRATHTCVYEFNHLLNEWRDARPYFSPEAVALLDSCLQEEGAVAVCEETNVIYAVCSSQVGCISINLIDGEVHCKDVRLLPRAEYMSEHLRLHDAVILNRKLYVVGGDEGGQGTDLVPTSKVIRFDPDTNQWQPCASMREERAKHTATSFNGYIYVCGGFNTRRLSSVERYNPATNQWQQRKPMRKFRSHHQAIVMKEQLWVGGGKSFTVSNAGAKKVLADWECYRPNDDNWQSLGSDMNDARCNFAAVSVRLY